MTAEILSAIERVVYKGYRCPTVRDSIVLDEPQATLGQCQSVTFTNAKDVLVYKFDQMVDDEQGRKIREPFLFLSKEKPARSKCDFLIFHTRLLGSGARRLYVFVCNMKSDEPGNSVDQFNSGEILSEFLVQTALRCLNFWNGGDTSGHFDYCNALKTKDIEFRRVSIANRRFRIQKGNTLPKHKLNVRQVECNRIYDFIDLFH